MGLTLLQSNVTFLKAVTACAAVVKPLGINLMAEFQADKGWKTPVLASVGLIAVQIGLVDILREEYGIIPHGMLGHSAGDKTARLHRIHAFLIILFSNHGMTCPYAVQHRTVAVDCPVSCTPILHLFVKVVQTCPPTLSSPS